jgi:DNA polymerase IV
MRFLRANDHLGDRSKSSRIFAPPDFTRYRAVSRLTRDIFKRHTDLVEPLSLDEAYLDVTENKTGLPTATRVASTIREQIRQELNLTASAGVAANKVFAKLASDWRKLDGLFVIQPEEVDSFLLPLLVGRLTGVGNVTGERLEKLGVKTVRELPDLHLEALENDRGERGAHGAERRRLRESSPSARIRCSVDHYEGGLNNEHLYSDDIPWMRG